MNSERKDRGVLVFPRGLEAVRWMVGLGFRGLGFGWGLGLGWNLGLNWDLGVWGSGFGNV